MWQYFFWAENRKWRWRFCIGAPLFAILFIYFEPLKGNIIKYENRFFSNILFLITSILYTLFCVFIVPKLAPKFFKKENWNIKKFYVWFAFFAFLASLMAYFFDINIEKVDNKLDWTIHYFLDYQVAVSCFTYAPMLAFFMFFDPEHIVKEDFEINELIESNELNISEKTEKLLQIKDNNERIELSINLNRFYYFKASDNYIEIFYKNAQNTFDAGNLDSLGRGSSRTVFRNTLKDIEHQFSDVPQLLRCHKAFIVNTEKVTEISGNAKGYFLTLDNIDEKIPVSRSNIDALKQRLPTFFK
jgi:LytTr DNA-binding domain